MISEFLRENAKMGENAKVRWNTKDTQGRRRTLVTMQTEPTLPFTTFRLTLSRSGGIADVEQTLALRWDSDAGSISLKQRGQQQSGPANGDRVLALWRRLEAVGFW